MYCIILDLNDNESLEVAIVENIQRDDLNVIEEAKGYKRLADEFKYDHEKIAKFMSKSRSHISNTMRLLSLPEDVIGMIEEGHITAGQARPLIGLSNATEIAEEIIMFFTPPLIYIFSKKKDGHNPSFSNFAFSTQYISSLLKRNTIGCLRYSFFLPFSSHVTFQN